MKERKYFNETTLYRVWSVYWNRYLEGPRTILKDSFPSETTTGWPERVIQHNLTRARTFEFITYSHIYDSNGYLRSISTTADQYLLPSSWERTLLQQTAMNKAIAKFMDGKQQLAADFAERQSTINMIGKRSMQAFNVLRNVRKGNLKRAISLMTNKKAKGRNAAELHLEWAYGWGPFLGSLFEICDKEFPPNPEIYISEKVTRKFSEDSGAMRTEGSLRSGCSFLAMMNSPLVASAEKLGLTNPASVAWEVVPFSFVVDWFIPISSYLQSLTAFSGFTVKDKCLSYSERLYCENINRTEGFGRTKTIKTIIRSTQFNLAMKPLPKNPLSTAHALNALALIRALRKD